MQSSMLLLFFLPRIVHSESVGSHVGLFLCTKTSSSCNYSESKVCPYVSFHSPPVVVKVSILLPGLWKTQSSMCVSLLTAGVDNDIQKGVFVIKVRSKSVSLWGLYESSKYR